jgi:hypothetical protein
VEYGWGLFHGVFIPPPFAERLTFCPGTCPTHAEETELWVDVEMSKHVYLLCKMMFSSINSYVFQTPSFIVTNMLFFFYFWFQLCSAQSINVQRMFSCSKKVIVASKDRGYREMFIR